MVSNGKSVDAKGRTMSSMCVSLIMIKVSSLTESLQTLLGALKESDDNTTLF